MKYRFDEIENGQISDGPTILTITNHEAEVNNSQERAVAILHGGKAVEPPKVVTKTLVQPKKDDGEK